MTEIAELWRFREVLLNLVRRNLKVRYKNSFLGFFWSLLNPLLQIGVWWFVFVIIMERNEENYMALLIAGFLPWLFFSQTVLDSASCVTQEMALVKKAYFPRSILPLSVVISNLIHLLFAFVVLLVLFAIWHVDVNVHYWLVLPATVLVAFFAYGVSAMLGAWAVYYADVKFIISNLMGLWFFLTPVLYSVAGFLNPDKTIHGHGWLGVIMNDWLGWLRRFYMADPITIGILGYRSALLQGGQNPIVSRLPSALNPLSAQELALQTKVQTAYPMDHYVAAAAMVAVVTAFVGHFIYGRLSRQFAERG